MIHTSRRSLITGLVSFLAAPAVVRAASLMPVKALPEAAFEYSGYYSVIPLSPIDPEMMKLLMARIEDAERIMLEVCGVPSTFLMN